MHVTASVMGMPELNGGPGDIEIEAATLDDLWDRVSGGEDERHLLAFVNGNPVEQNWDEVKLEDGDDVLFMIRVSGG
ncbi:MAG: MoaD/ThiS family protein [Planctomycetota bacterium]